MVTYQQMAKVISGAAVDVSGEKRYDKGLVAILVLSKSFFF